MDENEMMWCQMECANDLLAPSCERHIIDLGNVSRVMQAGSVLQLCLRNPSSFHSHFSQGKMLCFSDADPGIFAGLHIDKS